MNTNIFCKLCSVSFNTLTKQIRDSLLVDICDRCIRIHYRQCSGCLGRFKCAELEPLAEFRLCQQCYPNFDCCENCGLCTHIDNLSNGLCCECSVGCCDECGDEYNLNELVNGICESCSSDNEIMITPAPENKVGFLTTRPFSVELELIDSSYKIRDTVILPLWRFVSDGSLSDGGTEYLGGPFAGEQAITSTQAFDKATLEYRNIDKSCGYHIHLDATTESESAIENFVRFCVHTQDSIAKLCSKDRQNQYNGIKETPSSGLYCQKLPNYPANMTLEEYTYSVCGKCRVNKKDKYSAARYFWLNTHSYFYRMTMEIRLHQGAVNSKTVLCWAELWLKFFEYCKNTPFNPEMSNQILNYFDLIGMRKTTKTFYYDRLRKFA